MASTTANALRARAPRRIAAAAALLCALAMSCALAAPPKPPLILVVGDSISAAYGLPAGSGWTSLLQKRLTAERYPYRVVNASISGDTTATGRARLPTLLSEYRPAITVIELGGNDGLRGGSIEAMKANLDAMVAAAQKAGSRALLLGIRMPPNYGPAYVSRFQATFGEVASKRKAAVVPFLFDGFAEDDAMFQADRIHPVAAAQPKLLDNVWHVLQPMLATKGAGK